MQGSVYKSLISKWGEAHNGELFVMRLESPLEYSWGLGIALMAQTGLML